jgi:hypothetical protein
MQRRRLPFGLLHRQTSLSLTGQVGEFYPLDRRKEAISWRMHFLGVANVVKVIWFRSRISAARELPSSTKRGSVRTHLACTTSRSATAISSLTNLLVMDHYIRIAVAVNKLCELAWQRKGCQANSQPLRRFMASYLARGRRQKAERTFSLLSFILPRRKRIRSQG